MSTQEAGWVILGWIKLAQDCQWRAFVKTVMNF